MLFVQIIMLPVYCRSAVVPSEGVNLKGHITYESSKEPLRNFIDAIEKQTRYRIDLPKKWLDDHITILLKEISIEEGLSRVFKQLNLSHSLIISPEDNHIQIFLTHNTPVVNSRNTSNANQAFHSNSEAPIVTADASNSMSNSDSSEVSSLESTAVPPEDGVENITEADLLARRESSTPTLESLANSTAVPPEDGVQSMTEQEILLQQEAAAEQTATLSDDTAVPPEDGVYSPTEKELLQSQTKQVNNTTYAESAKDVPPEDFTGYNN